MGCTIGPQHRATTQRPWPLSRAVHNLPSRRHGRLATTVSFLEGCRQETQWRCDSGRHPKRTRAYAVVSYSVERRNRRAHRLHNSRGEQEALVERAQTTADALSLFGVYAVLGPRRLSRSCAPVGHVKCNQSEYQRIRMEKAFRGVSGTCSPRNEGDRQRELRRSCGYRRRTAFYWGHEL